MTYLVLLAPACGEDTLNGIPVPDPEPILCDDGSQVVNGECPPIPEPIPPPGTITGRLCNRDTGQWRPDVTVRIDTPEGILEDITNEAGQFTLTPIPPGSYYVHCAEGDFELDLFAEVSANETTVIGMDECIAPTGVIKGRACNSVTGAWIPNATVSLNDESITPINTDGEGFFSFSDIDEGDYVVTISDADFETSRSVTVVADTVTNIEPAECVGIPGTVAGRICGTDGHWLSGARVYIQLNDGTIIEAVTNTDGYYTLVGVPIGTHTVHAERGSYATSFEVTVSGGEDLILTDPVCIPPSSRMAVITGLYDSIQDVLTNLGASIHARYDTTNPVVVDPDGNIDLITGYETSFWAESFLTDPVWMNEYDIILFNCGLDDTELMMGTSNASNAIANLRDFVTEGGSVYASDWASEIIRMAFPGRINFLGNDSSFGEARYGEANSSQAAAVVDLNLESALGRRNLTLNLDLPQWVVLDARSTQPEDLRILVQSNITYYEYLAGLWPVSQSLTDSPIVVHFEAGEGRVLYTTAHNESQTTEDLRDVLNYIVFDL